MNLDKLFELNPKAVVWDGYDEAIVGMARKNQHGPIIITMLNDEDVYEEVIYLGETDDDGEETFDR